VSKEEKIFKIKVRNVRNSSQHFLSWLVLSYVICIGLASNFKAASLTGSARVGWA